MNSAEIELAKAIQESPIHALQRADNLVRLQAQAQMRELQDTFKYPRLEREGFRVYSQHDEDGIIQAIFNRIGTESMRFVEFGAGIGVESNCAYLLLQGWHGTWADGNETYVAFIKDKFAQQIAENKLTVLPKMITPVNLESLIGKTELDLLSIDVDGNDYYLLEALTSRPRVLVVEYNAAFPPPTRVVQKYQSDLVWGGTTYYGASLMALAKLAEKKRYRLVGTNITGVNAFFIREDILDATDKHAFSKDPVSSLYNPARYRLGEFGFDGHAPGWGPWT